MPFYAFFPHPLLFPPKPIQHTMAIVIFSNYAYIPAWIPQKTEPKAKCTCYYFMRRLFQVGNQFWGSLVHRMFVRQYSGVNTYGREGKVVVNWAEEETMQYCGPKDRLCHHTEFQSWSCPTVSQNGWVFIPTPWSIIEYWLPWEGQLTALPVRG